MALLRVQSRGRGYEVTGAVTQKTIRHIGWTIDGDYIVGLFIDGRMATTTVVDDDQMDHIRKSPFFIDEDCEKVEAPKVTEDTAQQAQEQEDAMELLLKGNEDMDLLPTHEPMRPRLSEDAILDQQRHGYHRSKESNATEKKNTLRDRRS